MDISNEIRIKNWKTDEKPAKMTEEAEASRAKAMKAVEAIFERYVGTLLDSLPLTFRRFLGVSSEISERSCLRLSFLTTV